jgi:SpoVK/Ycf46/Vps4 family AAA+-type ATPase
VEYYTTSLQHVLAELTRIDLLIQMQVARARQEHTADENLQGLYIPEDEVDRLLTKPAGLPRWAMEPPQTQSEAQRTLDQLTIEIARRKVESKERGVSLRLDRLALHFQLTTFEVDVLLIGLAPEIDLRYERLFGYLQDDVTRRRPSVDLVLNLLSPTFEAKLAARWHFTANAALFKHHLLQLFDDPAQPHPPLLNKYLKADERVVDYLFGGDEVDARLGPYVQRCTSQTAIDDLLLPVDVKRRLVRLARDHNSVGSPLIFYFQGPYGVGKQTTAEALARELGTAVLVVDGEQLINATEMSAETVIRLLTREALLQNALLYWQDFDVLLSDDRRAWRERLLHELAQRSGLTILAGDTTWEPLTLARELPFVRIEFAKPTYGERKQLWPRSLNGSIPIAATVDLAALASKFRFTAGQIQDATATARNLARWRDPVHGQVTMDDLYAASRLQSNRKLGELARKITPHYTWDDIVLPTDRMQQLREIVNQIKYRAKVYEEWGFDHKLAMGKGLNALFAGPSGTGKTMAADIMAGALGLDLYKIDLSTVVSKYIGETEKNLARIFVEAETSNAILFFDEADALFGKRSEVRDSHDRYANIEISYLLQRMEEYSGMVILATNLSKNLDEAFVRRMHFTVDFPFPDQKHRQRIWEKIWPAETPRDPTLDLALMARSFEVAGGNIRNIALAAAFFAADDGEVVQMSHLVRAIQREYQKMGKVVIDDEFGKFAKHVRRAG